MLNVFKRMMKLKFPCRPIRRARLQLESLGDRIVPATIWWGLTDNQWTEASNWSTNAVPGSTDDVDIPASAAVAGIPVSLAIKSLTTGSGSSLTFDAGTPAINVTDLLQFGSSSSVYGNFSNGGSIIANNLTLDSAASFLNTRASSDTTTLPTLRVWTTTTLDNSSTMQGFNEQLYNLTTSGSVYMDGFDWKPATTTVSNVATFSTTVSGGWNFANKAFSMTAGSVMTVPSNSGYIDLADSASSLTITGATINVVAGGTLAISTPTTGTIPPIVFNTSTVDIGSGSHMTTTGKANVQYDASYLLLASGSTMEANGTGIIQSDNYSYISMAGPSCLKGVAGMSLGLTTIDMDTGALVTSGTTGDAAIRCNTCVWNVNGVVTISGILVSYLDTWNDVRTGSYWAFILGDNNWTMSGCSLNLRWSYGNGITQFSVPVSGKTITISGGEVYANATGLPDAPDPVDPSPWFMYAMGGITSNFGEYGPYPISGDKYDDDHRLRLIVVSDERPQYDW